MLTDDVSLPGRERQASEAIDSAPVSESAEDEISILDLLIVLALGKRTVLTFTLLGAILSVAVAMLLPKSYQAEAVVMPPKQNTSMAAMMASQIGGLGGIASLAGGALGLKDQNDMYVAMFQSRVVEDQLIQRFGLAEEYHAHYVSDARKKLEGHSDIDGKGKDGLIHIKVDDRNPKRAAELTNGYVEEFQRLTEHLAITEAGQRRLFFEKEVEESKDKLGKAEEALVRTQQQTGMIELNSQSRALILAAAAIQAQIAAKEVQIRSLQTFAASQNAQLIQAQQELAGLRAQLVKLGASGTGDDADLVLPRGQVSEAGLEYVRRLRDVKYYETMFEFLARQLESAKLDEAQEGAVVQVVDPAIPPDRRSFPHRSLIVIISTFASFVIGLFAALVRGQLQKMGDDPVASVKLVQLRRAILRRA
jgi:LPS O-antigen subunit length determinant protein (WzzB/FepE family)